MEFGPWLRAPSPTHRQEKGGSRHSGWSRSSNFEKPTKKGSEHNFLGDEDLGWDDGGNPSEMFSNPKRTKVQKERYKNLRRNYGSQRGSNIAREIYAKGNHSINERRDMRAKEKENNNMRWE